MGFSENTCLLLAFLIYLFAFTLLISGLDTVALSVLIQEPETVSSNNGMFTPAFFRPQNSTSCYLEIGFMSESFVVWVANKNDPLTDSSGILTISGNHNLLVLNGQEQVVWSTNVSTASNSSAQLLDSGNLVLMDRTTAAVLWQSFQHPSNALLEGMKLDPNKKTGQKMQLASWKSTYDPSYGGFSFSLEPRNVTEIVVWKENHPCWQSGPWDGIAFIGISWMTQSIFKSGVQIKEEGEIYNISYDHINKSILMTIILDSQGIVKPMIWNSRANIWETRRKGFHSTCNVYGICGPYGICNKQGSLICGCLEGFEPKNKEEWARQKWTSGCIRRETLQCGRDKKGSQASKTDGWSSYVPKELLLHGLCL
ncbi:G-type lectin S-receptor-like serine/threonine-protein kinase At1g11330 [Neltuma alba]|uniref:G-type lectin S-receptor-like serine/threonine-protein kinase At1g11330 n=1 Tax=Neltuma alba TaxID=207710 RepID=UPI0010A4B1FA|nr:G-type lectin S-receptor-like serine/threonine-protein kinase At1g11330 [Prosopis alba]